METLQIRVERLTQMLNGLQKSMFGQSSEKRRYVIGDDQLSLFNEAEAETNKNASEPDKVSVVSYARKPKRTKEELAAALPVVEILCELDEGERVCGICEGKMRPLRKETAREELEMIPAQVRLLRYVRYSYVCKQCEKETGEAMIVKAPTPAPVMKKSLASASTVAHVMYQKYVNGMPLSRQEKDRANQGIVLSRATLANWIIRSATDWLEPIWKAMKTYLLKQEVICADETVI
jgi:transposase